MTVKLDAPLWETLKNTRYKKYLFHFATCGNPENPKISAIYFGDLDIISDQDLFLFSNSKRTQNQKEKEMISNFLNTVIKIYDSEEFFCVLEWKCSASNNLGLNSIMKRFTQLGGLDKDLNGYTMEQFKHVFFVHTYSLRNEIEKKYQPINGRDSIKMKEIFRCNNLDLTGILFGEEESKLSPHIMTDRQKIEYSIMGKIRYFKTIVDRMKNDQLYVNYEYHKKTKKILELFSFFNKVPLLSWIMKGILKKFGLF